MAAHCEVELDIFSGMPNPTWALSADDSDGLMRQVAALPQTGARELAGNLGYRGFIVRCTDGASMRTVRVQRGLVETENSKTVHARDEGRRLERWLLKTGEHHLSPEIFTVVERDLH